MECGGANKVLSVEEPGKCVYEMRFATPVVCDINHANILRLNLERSLEDEEE